MPRFSIVITCHNQEGFIADAVQSALGQPYASKEVIVVDDRSTDGSLAILRRFEAVIALERSETNLGANRSRNRGAARASGDYIVFLDGDDLLMPCALGVYDRAITATSPQLILGSLYFFKDAIPADDGDRAPAKIDLVEYDSFLQKDRSHRQSASCIVVERKAFWRVNGWDAGFFPYEDYDLTLRVGYSVKTLQILAPPTVFYRVHSENATREVKSIVGGVYHLIQKEREGGYPGGPRRRFERFAIIGGAAFGWIRRALATGCYREPAKLLFNAGPMIAAACARRVETMLRGRRPVHSIDLARGFEERVGGASYR